MLSKQPIVSAVMSAYNGATLIGETLESILSQRLQEIEVIVINDASTDDTLEVLESFKDPRVRVYSNKQNLGVSATRNHGVQLAQGEFVAMSDQDDLSLPERFEQQVQFLRERDDVVLAAAGAKELRAGKLSSRYIGELRSYLVHWRMFTRGGIVHSSVCFRRHVFLDEGIKYNEDLQYADDFDVFHQFARVGKMVVLPQELLIYREHEGANSRLHTKKMIKNGQRSLLAQYQNFLGLKPTADEIALLWRTFCEKQLCSSVDKLCDAGNLYFDAFEAFVRRSSLDSNEYRQLHDWVQTDWQSVVASHVRGHRSYQWARALQVANRPGLRRPTALKWLAALAGR
ncbi:MAG: glycosyltransferase family 2 protein [Burkholderiaceae bacterium]